MKLASVPMGTSSAMMAVLNPSFKGIPDAKSLAMYLLNALIQIKKNNLPIKIYVTQDVSNKISNILSALGIKFKTVSADKMTPPYIFLYTENGDIVIKTVDADGKEVATFRAPFSKFIESFEALFISRKGRAKQREKEKPLVVDEVIIGTEDLHKFMEKVKKILEEEES